MRSNAIKQGPARAPARAMLRATGLDDAAIAKPLVAVVHTWSDVSPCNLTLRDLAQHVRAGVIDDGGTPIEFNTIAVTDGIAMGSRRHARLAGLARDDRRFDRAGGQRPLPRRDGAAGRLRQDHPGRGDGGGAPGYPDRDPLRRHDHAGPLPAKHGDATSALTVQDVFEAVGAHCGRPHRRCRAAPHRDRTPAPAPAPAAASSPPTPWRWC